MATTTNYGWTTPNDTDLVKDGAAAIRTLGSSVDTTTKALNPSTTLGDIEYRSATANTNTRLGIGSTGQVLTVASGVPSWATPAGGSGGMTLLQSLTLSGASTTSSTLSGSYKMLRCIFYDVLATDTYNTMGIGLRANGGTGSTYGTVAQDDTGNYGVNTSATYVEIVSIVSNSNTKETSGIIDIPNYANSSSSVKTCTFAFASEGARIGNGNGRIVDGAAITTLTFRHTYPGTFTQGTVDIYGVN